MTVFPNPLIEQRADPYIHLHQDGWYYFIASVPEYDRLELRRAQTLEQLTDAKPVTVWRKPENGPMSHLIWAPELHFFNGQWVIYFAAAHAPEIKEGLFQHRMFALTCDSADPLSGNWVERGRVITPLDTFSLDATSFEYQGKRYYLWAQKDPEVYGNSNLYLAELENAWTIKGQPVMLSKPELEWETRGFWVNEGPAVIRRGGRIFIAYSASATDENYCMGLLWAKDGADILDASQWHKMQKPVFGTARHNRQFGPGHNSFTQTKEGNDVLVYHARNYTEIEGDPLYDPNRHTRIKTFEWDEQGMPVFGEPLADNR